MLRTLLESNAPPQRRRAGTSASIAFHTAAIGGAIVATASARPGTSPEPPAPDTPVIYTRTGEEPRPRMDRVASGDRVRVDVPKEGNLTHVEGPRWSHRYADALRGPAIDLHPDSMIAADSWPSCAVSPCRPRSDGQPGQPSGDEPATFASVERPAALRSPPRPRYPDQLRAARITGRVVVRFVVDTLGRIEPASVRISESSHDLFTHSVQAVLPTLRFAPAAAGGRKVRMLVDLPFEFRLNE